MDQSTCNHEYGRMEIPYGGMDLILKADIKEAKRIHEESPNIDVLFYNFCPECGKDLREEINEIRL